MLTNEVKEKIRVFMNANEFLCDKRMPTDESWDRYFIDSYNNNVEIHFFKNDFITWEVYFNSIVIKDFICTKGSGVYLINHVMKIHKKLRLPLICYIHLSNKQVLKIAMKRYGFKITNKVGKQYQLVKEVE